MPRSVVCDDTSVCALCGCQYLSSVRMSGSTSCASCQLCYDAVCTKASCWFKACSMCIISSSARSPPVHDHQRTSCMLCRIAVDYTFAVSFHAIMCTHYRTRNVEIYHMDTLQLRLSIFMLPSVLDPVNYYKHYFIWQLLFVTSRWYSAGRTGDRWVGSFTWRMKTDFPKRPLHSVQVTVASRADMTESNCLTVQFSADRLHCLLSCLEMANVTWVRRDCVRAKHSNAKLSDLIRKAGTQLNRSAVLLHCWQGKRVQAVQILSLRRPQQLKLGLIAHCCQIYNALNYILQTESAWQ